MDAQPTLRTSLYVALTLVIACTIAADVSAKPDRKPPAAATSLSDTEKQDLLHMYSEEKVAHDVYVRLGEKWGSRVFANISASEARHMNAVAGLLSKYNITAPTVGMPAGKFSEHWAQDLHDKLVAEGLVSEKNAMRVGVKIEELDIADLEQPLARTQQSDIRSVYTHLLAGSKNHLAAFNRQLNRGR